MDWGTIAAAQDIQHLQVTFDTFFQLLPFNFFGLSVGCGCGTFEWLLRVGSFDEFAL